MAGEDGFTARSKGDDIEGLGRLPGDFHAWRPDGHARYGKTAHTTRTPRENALHVRDRYVPLENHAIDDRCMTR